LGEHASGGSDIFGTPEQLHVSVGEQLENGLFT
jgi:hypothetical protein